jgi:molybdopterin molybdotransferase
MQGLDQLHLPVVSATADADFQAAQGLTEFVRCTLEGEPGAYRVRPTGSQSSGVLRSLSLGQGLIVVPPEVGSVRRDSVVRVILLNADAAAQPPV